MTEVYFDKRSNILYAHFEGELTAENLVAFIDEIDRSIQSTTAYIYTNFTRITKVYSVREIPVVRKQIQKALENFTSVKNAIVTKNPFFTAYIVLRQKTFRDDRYDLRVFTTEHAAINWLLQEQQLALDDMT